MPKIKNIIIFATIGIALILVYIFFIKNSPEEDNLVSTTNTPVPGVTPPETSQEIAVGQEFLSLLLNIKNIKLNDGIFSDPAFATLHDSSIVLIQEGNEGRPNPFAPIGSDNSFAPVVSDTSLEGGTAN
ncbi:hypothetical protein A3I95_03425 [Candidatus Nomurabacteria bacterium RIFCSPLOWO2_02_FULL_44_12]|uniref:Uncharacterized protein n=1 Tax=Candidatus Nomurabacteria bacterium RIFCSPLOWO2_12_FULL_44_11 TaxID=1801796 RepID=A0A1F6Y732_9BACT|nr:MAG: hypothetical protein A3E95_00935 [Candidatus Nomurabacteria bacterium RIFCSPHIGHO2_12_FULL_44_22b]OGJ02178.1 MAG: hypothetical protein A3G53_02185 [Candidatus Nomurabacteria bacterium RIFCSPLOWO2_12_FULL_44_11]OGJ07647.1 MAG: hypothetical protein A3I95_03425 [Candidatus Nomurabacteria bacterium RIFCSPLOWO2_02_FULL_44_12]